MAFLFSCCSSCCGLSFGEELYKDWDNHPAAQQYAFIRRLGEGGFSEVQLAEDNLTGKTVALKIVFLNKAGLQPDERRILAGEAKLLRMVAHPNIIRCMRVLETRRQQVLVLEHLSGGEMLQQLQRVKRYTEAHACRLFRQIVDAVAYLHSLGIMHRDIKPENCLLAKPAQHYKSKGKPVKVKLIDLGMAGLYRVKNPLYGCMGSPGFIAPEVVLGNAHTPAMDVYSLGVLLFVMLVGRKPWDAQRSHTLQYAIRATADAPGLTDPVFNALSPAAKQLLLMMLQEEPADRPSAGDVLNHVWMLQGQTTKADGSAATAPERLIQPAVQQRLRVLGNSRQVMGTARGMMLLHSRGSRAGAVAFHKAVKEARAKLQQQAAALIAAGQLPADGHEPATATGIGTSDVRTQQGGLGGIAIDTHGHLTTAQPTPSVGMTSETNTSRGAAAAAVLRNTAAAGGKDAVICSPNLARPASYADPLSAAAEAAAVTGSTAANGSRTGRHSTTIGDLARESLQHQSLLFTGPQRPPVVRAAAAAATGKVKVTRAASSEEPAAGTAVGVGGHFIAPDAAMVAEALERGMSVPNPDLAVGFSCSDEDYNRRYERAVSLSPGALALLDADDRLCLLGAGTSMDDEDSAALFSWSNRRGAAEMVASFKQRYPVKPIIRSIARFGHSLSASLSRSLRHSGGGLSSYRSGRYSPAPTTMRLGSGDDPELAAAVGNLQHAVPAMHTRSLPSAGTETSEVEQLLLLEDTASVALQTDDNGQTVTEPSFEVCGGLAGRKAYPSQQQQEMEPQRGATSATAAQAATGTPAADSTAAKPPHAVGAVVPSRSSAATSSKAGATAGARQTASLEAGEMAVGSSSAAASTEVDFLGTQLSMSPPLSPSAASTPVFTAAASRSLSPDATTVNTSRKRPSGTAAAAAANRHFKQQQIQQRRQQGQQAVLRPGVQALFSIPLGAHDMCMLPAIPSDASDSAASAGAPSESLLDELVEIVEPAACNTVSSRQQQQLNCRRKPALAGPFSSCGLQEAVVGAAAAAAGVSAASLHFTPAVFPTGRQVTRNSSGSSNHPNRPIIPNSSGNSSSLLPSPAAASRAMLCGPSSRAAATAAAARDEEEGLNLPNGLWLQQSQSLSETGRISPSPAQGLGGALGGLGFNMGLGLELTAARTLSSALDTPKGLLEHDSMLNLQLAEQQLSEAPDEDRQSPVAGLSALVTGETSEEVAAVIAGSCSIFQCNQEGQDEDSVALTATAGPRQGLEQQVEANETVTSHEQLSRRGVAQRHTRDMSVMDWLDPAEDLSEWQLGGDKDLSVIGWIGDEQDRQALMPATAPEGPATAVASEVGGQAARKRSSKAVEPSPKRPSSSRQIAVPHSLAGGSRHSAVKCRRWSSGHQHSRQKRPVSSEGGVDASAAGPAQTAAAEAGACAEVPGNLAEVGTVVSAVGTAASAADRGLGESLGDGEQEQGFYVGSFNDTQGLAGGHQLGLSDRLASDGLNPDEIEEMVVDELRQAAAQGWGFKSGQAGVAAAAAVVPEDAAPEAAKVCCSCLTTHLDKQPTSQGGLEDGDYPVVLMGLEESAPLDPLQASPEPFGTAAGNHTGTPCKGAAWKAPPHPAIGIHQKRRRSHGGKQTSSSVAAAITSEATSNLPGTLAAPSTPSAEAVDGGVGMQRPVAYAAASASVEASSISTGGPVGSTNWATDGGVAWLVKSLSGKYKVPGDVEDVASWGSVHVAANSSSRQTGKTKGAVLQQPAYDDFDEPTAWYYAS